MHLVITIAAYEDTDEDYEWPRDEDALVVRGDFDSLIDLDFGRGIQRKVEGVIGDFDKWEQEQIVKEKTDARD